MNEIVTELKSIINEKGLKFKKVSEKTLIPYQRLNRIFNQNASLSATEFLSLCSFLNVDPNIFKKSA